MLSWNEYIMKMKIGIDSTNFTCTGRIFHLFSVTAFFGESVGQKIILAYEWDRSTAQMCECLNRWMAARQAEWFNLYIIIISLLIIKY